MKDPWILDKNFNGLSDEIFDDVIKFFDFPLEDVETNLAEEEDWDAQFKRIEEPSFDVFSVSSSELCGKTQNGNSKLGRTFSASCNEVYPIKQEAETAEPNVSFNKKDLLHFQTYSPVSVFESSSSSCGENSNFDLPVIPAKRARGRRRRLSSFSPLLSIPFISTSPPPPYQKSHTDSDMETHLKAGKLLNRMKKERKKDVLLLSGDTDTNMNKSSGEDLGAPRKCMHCEVTKTPQWREGPMGPKTLCNACGVRYRSGRLFPEYRPAASPTFVPSLHSNSHRRVIEMRKRGGIQKTLGRGSILAFASNLPANSLG
ncbi:GATA transcription factor 11 isoform X2 [Senna tora]|uniref:GATA transcription factor 11 isoform X2 n=1 Tax=Senna tora TaxID=362788 RepID=A0A834TM24_9FABA|nr:GATA transcription factor 11 isoform X2 [Senna tora]